VTLPSKPLVVATNAILASLVTQVAGSAVRVVTVVPNHKDPHDFEAGAKDTAALSRAKLIVENGLGLEQNIAKSIDQAQARGIPVWTLADHLRTANGDPHVFTNPVLVMEAVPSLVDVLSRVAAINSADVILSTDAYLQGANDNVVKIMATIPRQNCQIVTGEKSMQYFATQYGCTNLAVQQSISSGADLSAKSLVATKKFAQSHHIRALFVEEGTSGAVVSLLADELHIPVLELPVHSVPANGTYADYVSGLATVLAHGLGRAS
jgi:zinc/manganese transport system substrate-binding protein